MHERSQLLSGLREDVGLGDRLLTSEAQMAVFG